MSEWKTKKLSEVATVIDSLHKTPSYVEKGFPMVRVTDVKGGYLDLRDTFKVSESVYEEFSKKHKPQKGDLVFSRVGTYGFISFVKDDTPFCLGQNTVFIVPEIEPHFLFYFLNSPIGKYQINSFATGSTQKTISLASIKNIDITLPSLQEQKEITSVLSCLDDKIENLRKQNQTLEKVAQTLFKHWFIDFEFPNENGEPYQSSGGAMKPSELGEIPEGWRVGKMKELIDVKDGTHDSPKQSEQGFYLITSKHLKKQGIDFNSAYLISENDYTEINKRSRVNTYDILLSMIGTVGILYFVIESEINFAIKNIGLFKSSQNTNYAEFIYLFLNSSYGQSYLGTRLAGTTQSYITLGSLREMPIIIPKPENLMNFRNIVCPNFNKYHLDNTQIQTLTKTRDTLLPKLMSGKLRIQEENIIEEGNETS